MFCDLYDRPQLILDGVWKYKLDQNDIGKRQSYYLESHDHSAWRDITVPHNWYLTDEIGDYFGTIWYCREFAVPEELNDGNLYLRFEGVDYISEVWVNGVYLGKHEGMFNSFEYDITDVIRCDVRNTIVLRDSAPKDPTEYVLADNESTPLSEPYKFHQSKGISQIKGHMAEAMHRPGSMTSFRQDGNSGGLWGSVTLIAKPDIHISYIKSYTKIGYKKDWLGDQQDKPDGTGLAAFDVYVHSKEKRAIRTAIALDVHPSNFKGGKTASITRDIVVQPGDNVFKLFITLEDVRLWWTWDHGYPHLYRAECRLELDNVSLTIGFKEIQTDADGQWYLNGKKIFLRGMRYISSLWMSEANEEMWQADLKKMLDMDINSIRIGSHVEKDGFYRLCDEMGLLMWQVFPLHYCVSDDDDLIMRASDMIRDMGYMLTNHACMGMWSVYKEPEIYFLPDKPNNYFRLCQILKETLKSVDPTRWVHLGDYREGVTNIMTGCCSDGDTNVKDKIIPPNIVEFGSQSLPCLETLKTFIPEDKLWPITDWDLWEYWGLFYSNTFKFAKVEIGNSIEEFISNTQEYEAISVKEQIEFLRQRKYNPVGTMYLYYWSDACPMIGSGLLDYYRRPYKVYDAMQMVYTPVLISLEPCMTPYVLGRKKVFEAGKSFTARVWVINDHYHKVDKARIHWEIVDQSTKRAVGENGYVLNLPEDSAEIADHIIWPAPAEETGKEYRVNLSVTADDGAILSRNYFDFTLK